MKGLKKAMVRGFYTSEIHLRLSRAPADSSSRHRTSLAQSPAKSQSPPTLLPISNRQHPQAHHLPLSTLPAAKPPMRPVSRAARPSLRADLP